MTSLDQTIGTLSGKYYKKYYLEFLPKKKKKKWRLIVLRCRNISSHDYFNLVQDEHLIPQASYMLKNMNHGAYNFSSDMNLGLSLV